MDIVKPFGSGFTVEAIAEVEQDITLADAAEVEDSTRPVEDVTIADITDEHIELTKKMLRFLATTGAIGLSAPQVGIHKKFFVYWSTTEAPRVCYNAEYFVGKETPTRRIEQCLTYPGQSFLVRRYKQVQAKWFEYDPTTKQLVKFTQKLSGRDAQIFQHETDHLKRITIARREQ